MENILEVKELKKTFYKNKVPFQAVKSVSFQMKKGQCMGIVGESGCGKSTTAKIITHLTIPDGGSIQLNGRETLSLRGKSLRKLYGEVQMVFQTPQDSFDPRCTLGDGIMEGMRNRGMRKRKAKERMYELLDMVELDGGFAARYPHEVSGGQCQRAAIARALAPNPQLVICDEATSALDVTVQAQIVELLKRLQKEQGLSLILISHDLALVQNLCDHVAVMYKGSVVEQGAADEVIRNPKETYTQMLVDSVFGWESPGRRQPFIYGGVCPAGCGTA
ncbi:MAG: ABC transporter ATP-binding protein [Lachnospiraceae bacterium]|nr:ABC transporter ATP-binding protein [Lachnospiraceae bacterium]